MSLQNLGALVTIVAFGCLGLVLAYRRAEPMGRRQGILLGVLAVVGIFIGASTRLLDAFGFLMPLNWAIVAGCSGAMVGSFLRSARLRRPQSP